MLRIFAAIFIALTSCLCVLVERALAESRFALLIGNQSYNEKVGPLKNTHNDIALVGAALEKLGFKTTLVKDAGYKTIDTAIKRHIQSVRREGKGTIGLVYYTGHGAADPDTNLNYLIPVDVANVDDDDLWTNSLNLNGIVESLRAQAPDATHYVVFDACRNELKLTRKGRKALVDKGFVPIAYTPGVMVAYATAPGRTAMDAGNGGGPYATALAEEIVKPGVEAMTMFRRVALRVHREIGQDPWLSASTLPEVYFAGSKPPGPTPEQQMELAFWASVKDSTSPAVLNTYLERYPGGEFAPIARALVEHYERRLKVEQAAREEERMRQEEARKAADVRRLEEARRVREAALAEERRLAEEAKNRPEATRVEEQERAELIARTQELRKALEEARLAREAAKAAEEQRIAAIKAANEATRAAEQTIASKREAESTGDPTKVAALPKIEKPQSTDQFDGNWIISVTSETCSVKKSEFSITIANGAIGGRVKAGSISGSMSASGVASWTLPSLRDGKPVIHSGTFRGRAGSGTYSHPGCGGTFTAKRT